MQSSQAIAHFRDQIMDRFFLLSCVHQKDNYDVDRFGAYGQNEIEKYNRDFHRKYLYFFLNNTAGFWQTYQWLSDENSKKLFVEILLYRLLGFPHVRLSINNDEHWLARKRAQDLLGHNSDFNLCIQDRVVKHYEFDYCDQKILYDGLPSNIAWSFFMPMYEYKAGDVSVKVEENDTVYDCGACFGDTALKFAVQTGEKGIVESFDFLPNHLAIINYNKKQNGYMDGVINVHPYAVGQKTRNTDKAIAENSGNMKPGASLLYGTFSETDVPMVSLDDWQSQNKIGKPDFIKMDIEGYEEEALRGGSHLIKEFKPKLAISLYHKQTDFILLPALLKSLVPEYKFYLGHYTIHQEETVLYARVD